ncbi:MAG: hypothetical protein XXXJIFNMEKO3_00985 [Candidatus Erwinia impunctatus]|nr:hypothetical protein XXXJIFNMEKO_00985 [Culicoides impunctatus]
MLLTRPFAAGSILAASFMSAVVFSSQPAEADKVIVSIETTPSVHTENAALRQYLKTGKRPFFYHPLQVLYHTQGMKLLWEDSEVVRLFERQLAEVALSGVNPQFSEWLRDLNDTTISPEARDVLLSDAMLGYLQFVSEVPARGEQWLYSQKPYPLAAPSQSVITRWQKALRQNQLRDFVAQLQPIHPQYSRMVTALKSILADKTTWPELHATTSLRPGDESDDVPAIRVILQHFNMLTPSEPPADGPTVDSKSAVSSPLVDDDDNDAQALSISSPEDVNRVPEISEVQKNSRDPSRLYSAELVEGIKRFQHWQGLDADGIVGRKTREWLSVSPRDRATLLALNMQRLRLLPDDMHNGIMVNIPNYSLNYYVDGVQVLTSRVIVGSPKRKTPLMRSALNNVVLNPPWNVPTTLAREDIAPKIKKDPAYLDSHQYTLYSGWGEDAQRIDPATIDWSTVSSSRFPYRIRQAPGPLNSLGRYKFNMPSTDAIYLHDTPNHGLFNREIRALSSGCVRVDEAATLAKLLLQDAGWSEARIESRLQEGNTQYVSIKHRIPVNLYYLTAWISDDGQAEYRTDIYQYDTLSRAGESILSVAENLIR